VFVVAGAGDGFNPAEILFEREGMRRDSAPSRKAGEKPAPTVTNGPPFSRTGNDRVETDAIVIAKTLTCGAGQRYDSETDNFIVGALGARTGLSQGVQDASVGHMIVHGTQEPCVSDIAFAQGRNNGAENVLVMTSQVGGNQGGDYIMHQMVVRRLTPRECERLQGFPDNYTDIPKAADGPRYKALGNSMAVPVMRWIGKRIEKFNTENKA
jgi:DNA (cytosine-5)-methyltransferase 1